MITEFFQNQAALYASGAMNAWEREQFEIVIESNDELRDCVIGLSEVGAALTLATQWAMVGEMPTGLKARITSVADGRPQQTASDGMVMTGPDGLVQWVNPAFSEMCGYSLEELRGKKLGPILQGADTDRETAARMRREVHALRPCRETILNYHKSGTPYWVDVAIAPIVDDAGELLCLVARERAMTDTVGV